MKAFHENIKDYFQMEIETIRILDIDAINEAMNALVDARDRDAIIYVFGNGGSAATASHFVCDFNKGASEKLNGRKFHFRCLSDNVPILTAIANDISYDDVFLFQLEKLLRPKDLIIAISGSGNSKNIIKAVQYARSLGTPVIGVTGYSGGRLRELSDYSMHVPLEDMQITEDLHMMFDHMMLRVLGENLKNRREVYTKPAYLKHTIVYKENRRYLSGRK
jgi:Phosphoheptose isomerase